MGCAEELAACLEREPNRLAVDLAQKQNIKFTRPTEECDVCEGSALSTPLHQADHYSERFAPVRSSVRENALWSLVILCSQGALELGGALHPTVAALTKVVREDRNAVCVGFGMDALQ